MGNTNEPINQNTYKICMQCHNKKIINNSFMILNMTHYNNLMSELFLRCSDGHLCTYRGNTEHIKYCYEQIQKKSSLENKYLSKIYELNEEIIYLKKEIEKLTNNNIDLEPSAPPLVEAQLI